MTLRWISSCHSARSSSRGIERGHELVAHERGVVGVQAEQFAGGVIDRCAALFPGIHAAEVEQRGEARGVAQVNDSPYVLNGCLEGDISTSGVWLCTLEKSEELL